MSADIAVRENDLVVFSLWGRCYGQETRTEYAYVQSSPDDVDLLGGYCGFFEDQKVPVIAAMSTHDLLYFNIRADVWEPVVDGFNSVGWRDFPINVEGSVGTAGAGLPPNNALVMRRRVGPAGRANRGRVYLPAVPTSWQVGGVFGGGAVIDAANNFKLEMARSLADATVPTPVAIADPVLLKHSPAGGILSFLYINYWDMNPYVRSQRRREPGVGI